MKKSIYFFVFVTNFIIVFSPALAQSNDIQLKIKDARLYMKGQRKPYNPVKSFQLYRECAKLGNLEAMNALGNMYNAGIGTEKNLELAEEWFQKASNAGYAKATFNLATLHMYSDEKEPEFDKAYEYFKKASDLGNKDAWYHEGYMLYKGLGCLQNYNLAAKLFIKGAEVGKNRSMHFLGLCYLNGYGVTQDISLAKKWLEKSAKDGNEEAKKALALEGPEGVPSEYLRAISKEAEIPGEYVTVRHYVTAENLSGNYKGYIVTYDWSGSKIVQLLPLSLTLKADGNNITGQWTESKEFNTSITAKLTPNGLIFNSPAYRRKDNYNNEGLWLLKNANIELSNHNNLVNLKGNLKMFSPETLEPGKPQFITLTRVAVQGETISRKEIAISVFPNPCTDKTTLTFTTFSESTAEVVIQSLWGKQLVKKNLGKISIGDHSIELPINLSTGSYVFKLHSGNEVHSTILLKQ